jgi:exopolyphosphatase / guanosine-5'-triphosphate,3'-diphosphate pyrophosphatase
VSQPAGSNASRTDRAAAIDIGTNSVLLLIAERRDAALVAILERATITRLGEGVDRTRKLASAAIERTLACVADYARQIDAHGVSRLDVVGTSALRDVTGAEPFLAECERLLGARPRVIQGGEEARLSFDGALSGLTVSGDVCVCDIGGGSTEIVLGHAHSNRGEPTSATSLDVGSVRLFERHVRGDPPSSDALHAARAELRRELDTAQRPPAGATIVGVAGTVTTLAAIELELSSYDGARVHGHVLSRDSTEALAARLAASTLAERRKLPGLEPGRADVIVTGALVACELLAWANASELIVSDRGVRWGLVEQMLDG